MILSVRFAASLSSHRECTAGFLLTTRKGTGERKGYPVAQNGSVRRKSKSPWTR